MRPVGRLIAPEHPPLGGFRFPITAPEIGYGGELSTEIEATPLILNSMILDSWKNSHFKSDTYRVYSEELGGLS